MAAVPTIRVDGLTLYTRHGVGAAEREIGQRLIIDLELIPAQCGATHSDDVAETVDYGALTELVAATATGESFRTLERLVTVIADRVFERFPATAELTVRATKPVPPIPFTVSGASVEITRRRKDEGA